MNTNKLKKLNNKVFPRNMKIKNSLIHQIIRFNKMVYLSLMKKQTLISLN